MPQRFSIWDQTTLENECKLPINYLLAKAQLDKLENWLQQQPDPRFRYIQTIGGEIKRGFVEETERHPNFTKSPFGYLQHHPVEHIKK